MPEGDIHAFLVRHLLDPAPRWIAVVFILAYLLALSFRLMEFLARSSANPLWGLSTSLQLMFAQPTIVVVLKASAFAALLILISATLAVQLLKLFAGLGLFVAFVSGIIYGFAKFLGRGIVVEPTLSMLPATGNLVADLLLSALFPLLNILSLLFDHAAWTVRVTMPAVPLMMLVSSALGFTAMRIDKFQAMREGWRLSERSIVWYSITGGGPGVLAAAITYRHKIRHPGLLAQVILSTVLVYSVALAGLSAT